MLQSLHGSHTQFEMCQEKLVFHFIYTEWLRIDRNGMGRESFLRDWDRTGVFLWEWDRTGVFLWEWDGTRVLLWHILIPITICIAYVCFILWMCILQVAGHEAVIQLFIENTTGIHVTGLQTATKMAAHFLRIVSYNFTCLLLCEWPNLSETSPCTQRVPTLLQHSVSELPSVNNASLSFVTPWEATVNCGSWLASAWIHEFYQL